MHLLVYDIPEGHLSKPRYSREASQPRKKELWGVQTSLRYLPTPESSFPRPKKNFEVSRGPLGPPDSWKLIFCPLEKPNLVFSGRS